METPTLSPSEKLTLKHLAEGELHPRELDWLALQRLKERAAGFKLTQAGRDALRRLVLRA